MKTIDRYTKRSKNIDIWSTVDYNLEEGDARDLLNLYFSKSPENQVDKSFKKGAKLVHELLEDGKIDADVAKSILMHFAEIYIEHKFEVKIHKFFSRYEDKFAINMIRSYLGSGYE